MQPVVQASFYHWRVELDPEATRTAYERLDALDPACCNACATLRAALRRSRLPAPIIDFLLAAGADPAKAQEVWGAPEGGFLNAWWVVVGRMLDGEWDGRGERSYVELAPGVKCWITGERSMLPPPVLEGQPLLQLEFVWNDEVQLPVLEVEARTEIGPQGSAT